MLYLKKFHLKFSNLYKNISTNHGTIQVSKSQVTNFDKTCYYFENGLRKVHPYYFNYETATKKRWVGEKILDIFKREFRAFPPSEYEKCIRSGTLTVNNKTIDINYKLKHNDILRKLVHMHEHPVVGQKIKIIYSDEDIVVIDKPSSIPIYPCGQYYYNTVIQILAKDYNLKSLKTIHRLDKLTSGLLLLGCKSNVCSQIISQFKNRLVKKEYVCRVNGEFPYQEIECNEPIKQLKHKISVCIISPNGKDSVTLFKRIGYNAKSKTSVLLCYPKTGRMHQIRVHLQYLGYPIVKDPIYNHPVFGPLQGKGGDIGGKTVEQLTAEVTSIHDKRQKQLVQKDNDFYDPMLNIKSCENICKIIEKPLQICHPIRDFKPSVQMVSADNSNFDPDCYNCKFQYYIPRPQDMVMYLHACKYKGPDWEYKTDLPHWAKTEWEEEG